MTKYSVNLSFEKPRAVSKIVEAGVALLIFAAAFL